MQRPKIYTLENGAARFLTNWFHVAYRRREKIQARIQHTFRPNESTMRLSTIYLLRPRKEYVMHLFPRPLP